MSSELGPLVAERMRVTVLSAPVKDAVPMSFSQLRARNTCLVEIEADGIVGIGESWINYPSWAAAERVATLTEGVAPLLLGRDVSSPPAMQAALTQALLPVGRQAGALGPIWQAISGVDLAFWDLLGKAQGRTVAQLLSSGDSEVRSSVPAYASGVGPTDVEQLCGLALDMGLAAIKTKVGFGRDVDARTIAVARAAIGPDTGLFADANQAWDLAAAEDFCRSMGDYGIGWLEEPLSGDRLGELRKLASRTGMALAGGENVYGFEEFENRIESGVLRLVQPDLAKSGGITMAHRVATRSDASATGLAPHWYGGAVGLAASLQLAAAHRSAEWMELDVRPNPLRDDLLTSALTVVGGELSVPPGAGLGIELEPSVVNRYTIRTEERTRHDLS